MIPALILLAGAILLLFSEVFLAGLQRTHQPILAFATCVIAGAFGASNAFEPSRAVFNGFGVLARVGSYDVAPDGRFLMLKQVETPGAASELPTVVVVKNWAEELKRRVPPAR